MTYISNPGGAQAGEAGAVGFKQAVVAELRGADGAAATGTGAPQFQGTAATGAAVVGNPVLVGGQDPAGNVEPFLTTVGRALVQRTLEGANAAYRSGITSADVLPALGTITCTKLTGVGSITAAPYFLGVAAVNAYGRGVGKAGNTSVTTETTNLGINLAFAKVTDANGVDAVAYDIYIGITGASTSLCVGRITEAQRASGCTITVAATATANCTVANVGSSVGGANSVDVYVTATAGAGAYPTTAAVSSAHVLPAAAVVCTGFSECRFGIIASRTVDFTALNLTAIPWFLNTSDSNYYAGSPVTFNFGGASGAYDSLYQVFPVDVRGCTSVKLTFPIILGTGASITVVSALS